MTGAKSGCLCRFSGSHFGYDYVQWTVSPVDLSTYLSDLELCYLGDVVFVVDTIAKKVTKVA